MTSISEMEVRELAESAAKNLHSLPTGERQITQAARATLSTRGFAQTILSLLDENQALRDRLEAVEGERDEAKEILRQFLRCEYDGDGLYDCTDNTGIAYQSADLAQKIAKAEALLSASPSVNQSTQGKEDSHE